jgi:hypothetical protein
MKAAPPGSVALLTVPYLHCAKMGEGGGVLSLKDN